MEKNLTAKEIYNRLLEATDAFEQIKMLEMLAAKKVIINGKQTIVVWNDGSKTITTCSEEDTFDPYVGIMSALLKKILGTEMFHTKMERAMKKIVTAKKKKEAKKPATQKKTAAQKKSK